MTSSRRWMAVAHSPAEEARDAGRQAAAEAITGPDPKLLIVFATHDLDPRAVLEGVAAAAPGVPVIGCTTAGEISAQGPTDGTVVVTALGGPGFDVRTGSAAFGDDPKEAAGRAAECIDDLPEVDGGAAQEFVIVLADGLTSQKEEIVLGTYRTIGAGTPLIGGFAGDGLHLTETRIFHGTEVLAPGIVTAAISSDGPVGIGVAHGWSRVGEKVVVTESVGPVIRTLDERPALEVYLERLGIDSLPSGDAQTEYTNHHPLGVQQREADLARWIAAVDEAEGTLTLMTNVPAGTPMWVMEGTTETVIDSSATACSGAVDELDGHAPIGMLAFDCIARRGTLGESGIHTEVQRILASSHGAPVAGFYTYGEIARTQGVHGFHNQTLVVAAVG